MYGLKYSGSCYDIVWGNRFSDKDQSVIRYGQHSASSTDWPWCYTKGKCWDYTSPADAETPNHQVPNPGACSALQWTYLDRRKSQKKAAQCNPARPSGRVYGRLMNASSLFDLRPEKPRLHAEEIFSPVVMGKFRSRKAR